MSPHPARLGRPLLNETDQALSGIDHPQAQERRAADRPGQDRFRGLPRHRGDTVDVSPLAAAIRRHAGRVSQTADSAGEGERPAQKGFWRRQTWRQLCSRISPMDTSEPGASPAGRHGPTGALPGIRPADLPSGGAAPQYPTPFAQGRLNRGGKASPVSPGDRSGAHPLGSPNGLSPAVEVGMERELQAGATALEGGLPAAAHSQEAQAGTARRWLRAASPG